MYLRSYMFTKQIRHLKVGVLTSFPWIPGLLSAVAHSLDSRIAGRQVPSPRCLSPAAHSLDSRIAGRQVPWPRCLSPKIIPFVLVLRAKDCLDVHLKFHKNDSTTIFDKNIVALLKVELSTAGSRGPAVNNTAAWSRLMCRRLNQLV